MYNDTYNENLNLNNQLKLKDDIIFKLDSALVKYEKKINELNNIINNELKYKSTRA